MLDQINVPGDIKSLTFDELDQLAVEIRQRIIQVMAKNGGHLASNLGAVDFIIALHYVFSSPQDRLLFDTSHQSYPHKLLTGRHAQFESIRQYRGLCGFSHPQESEHDPFYSGHAGTALSLALGLAKDRDLREGKEHVIPVIGDANLTCGITLEALNNIPQSLSRFLTILNDNEMSIYKSVGAISKILSRAINSPTSNDIYQEIKKFLLKIPGCGSRLTDKGRKLKESVKNMISPAPFFEQFELSYVGPIDGHNIREMVKTFQALKDNPKATIVHLITQKGKGMEVASNNPTAYHGVKPFDCVTGKFHPAKTARPSFPKVFGKQLLEMGKQDPHIFCISPATPVGSQLIPFMEAFPERSCDVGIAEEHAVCYAGGLAKGGRLKVVLVIYATFAQRALDNIFQEICLQRLPVLIALDRAFLSGPDGSTHHGIYDIGFLIGMPHLVICQPRSGQLLKELMAAAFLYERPVVLRYPNLPTDEGQETLQERPLGKGEIVAEGSDLIIVALGHMVDMGLKVRALLKKEGIDAAVVDPIFVKPLDESLFVDLIEKMPFVVVIEEHAEASGLGMVLSHFIQQKRLQNVQFHHFGIPDRFIDHGKNSDLYEEIGLTPEKISQKVALSIRSQAHDHCPIP